MFKVLILTQSPVSNLNSTLKRQIFSHIKDEIQYKPLK